MFEIERGILQKAQKDKVQADIIRQWFEYCDFYHDVDFVIMFYANRCPTKG
ncbi:type II toxin-antitoxin system VapC family toxin [Moraxella equi]|uniref:Uncharacterized protein n=1 Tax=Moraxella equi TaxID=60442 RepID=A0A378QQ11_9GAMM|nr:type II toxin-antitoxin system VapC family toxin [Moraxella equi]STZ02986.1 Uncharacterised protein [Moraxella equi]